MSLSPSIGDREFQKFKEVNGETATRVSVEESALPTGAATAAKQDEQTAQLQAANSKLDTLHSDLVTVEGKQDTGNASLASIDSKVSTAANQTTLNTRIGDLTETAPATDTASSGLNGRLQRIAQRLTDLIAFFALDFGALSNAIRVAAQIGNASGAADFGSGATSGQTQRVASNLYDSAGNAISSLTTGDGASDSNRGVVAKAFGYLFNGTSFDRTRSASVGNNVAATGLLASVNYGQYNTTRADLSSGNYSARLLDENGIALSKPDFAGYTLMNKVFSVCTDFVTIPTQLETPLFILSNPNASGITLRLFQLNFSSNDGTTRHNMQFKVYANPTITLNGTPLTPVNNRIKTSPVASVAQAFVSPTISVNGALIFSSIKFGQTEDIPFPIQNQVVIEANSKVLVTVKGSVNNIPMGVCVWWAEV